MSKKKGFLKGAWDLTAAMMDNPKQAMDDIQRGYLVSSSSQRTLKFESLLAFGGVGLLIGVAVTHNPISATVGAASLFSGLSRYHAIGSGAREVEEAIRSQANSHIDRILDELQAGMERSGPLKAQAPDGRAAGTLIIEGEYRIIKQGDDSGAPQAIKGAAGPEAHL